MIIKKIKRGSKAGLKRLLNYITEPEKNGAEKCTEARSLGDFCTDDIETQKAEIISTVYQAKNSPQPAEHFVLSWRPEEKPTSEQIREAVEILTAELNCTGHQVMYGIHQDRDHIHAHAIINRAKDGENVVPANFLIDKQHRAIAIIADRQQWKPTPNQKYIIQNGQIIDNPNKADYSQARGIKLTDGAKRAEINNGYKSAERIAQEVVPKAIKQAKTWREFHETLALEGMKYQTKGSGAIIEVITGKGSQHVKASTAHKQASLSNLTKRYGTFEPNTAEITPRQFEPIQTVNLEQVREYNDKKELQRNQQDQEREKLRTRHGEEWQALKARQTQERVQLLQSQQWTGKGQELNKLRQAIAQQQRQEQEQLKARQAEERKQITKYSPTFAEYLKAQLLTKPHKENDQISELIKRSGTEALKITAKLAINPFAEMMKPARRQLELEQDEADERERESDQFYDHYR